MTIESKNSIKPIKSYRGILKNRGISIERLRELQREDKAIEFSGQFVSSDHHELEEMLLDLYEFYKEV